MAARRSLFCLLGLTTLLSKLIFLGNICLICGTESTVFTEEEFNKESDNGATLLTTGVHASVSIEDTLLTGSVYEEQPSTESMLDPKADTNDVIDLFDKSTTTINEQDATNSETNTDKSHSNLDTDNTYAQDLKSTSENQSPNTVNNSEQSENITHTDDQTLTNVTDGNSQNVSEPDGNSTNKILQPFWSCVKYNISEQNVIILKDKNSLVWWFDELNKTMGCAVVLFYAKWCYFSTSLAPMYNAVGRAFSGIPILAIDAYTHNSLNTRYGIVGVPTIILFQESRPVARFNRSRTFKDLIEFIHQSTGMEYNASVEVSPIDYDEGPLSSTPSDDFNFHLFASLCFLLSMAVLVLWRLQYVQVFLEYFMSLTVVRTMLGRTEREKND